MVVASMKIDNIMSPVSLLDDFPRWLGHPIQDFVAYDCEQRDAYIRKWLRRSDIYISVYKFLYVDSETGLPDRKSAWVDKVFFDFDSEQWLDDLIRVHKWCVERDIIHRCHCSGRGGHAFIFTNPIIQNRKQAVRNFQNYICENLGVDLDPKIKGDLSRIFRYPNTYNFKGQRFCIPVPPHMLDNPSITREQVFKLAERQQFGNPWSGSRLLSLARFDIETLMYEEEIDYEAAIESSTHAVDVDYPNFPPCVRSWLSTPNLRDYGKFLIVLYLRDQVAIDNAFGTSDIIAILRNSLSRGEFEHYFGGSRGELPRDHYGHYGRKFRCTMNSNYSMPSCDTLKRLGYCPEDCGRRHPIFD
jgi:hypothetical protein